MAMAIRENETVAKCESQSQRRECAESSQVVDPFQKKV